MEKYTRPEMEIVDVETKDIIMTSAPDAGSLDDNELPPQGL